MTAGPEEIAQAVARLRAGGLVAFPTETVYGLGADALDPGAVAKVFTLKGRPANNPLIVHVAGEAMARTVVSRWTPEAAALAKALWPGPLTIVLPRTAGVPDIVTAGGTTVGVRCPAHHITLSLLEAFGRPLVGPSANPSGRVSPTAAEHVREAFTAEQVYVLDGGPCLAGIESTVVTLVESPPRILRPGLVSAGQIAKVLRCEVREADAAEQNRDRAGKESPAHASTPFSSPGQLPVHYAPRARTTLFDSPALDSLLTACHGRAVILARTIRAVPAPHALIRMPDEAAAYATRLYAALREADAASPALIAVERPPSTGPIWDAITDRLRRATSSVP